MHLRVRPSEHGSRTETDQFLWQSDFSRQRRRRVFRCLIRRLDHTANSDVTAGHRAAVCCVGSRYYWQSRRQIERLLLTGCSTVTTVMFHWLNSALLGRRDPRHTTVICDFRYRLNLHNHVVKDSYHCYWTNWNFGMLVQVNAPRIWYESLFAHAHENYTYIVFLKLND